MKSYISLLTKAFVVAAVLLSALLCSGQGLKTITECRAYREAWMASAEDDVKHLPVRELLRRTDELMTCAKETDAKPIESGMTQDEAFKALTAHVGYATLALAYSQQAFNRAAWFIDSRNLTHDFITADEKGKIQQPNSSTERK